MSGSPSGSGAASGPDLPTVAALLQTHEVECILVGGMSAVLHGSTVTTKDIDTVLRWTRANLDRLCRALNSVAAEIMVRPSPDGDPANEVYRRLPGGIDYDDIAHLGSFRVRTAAGDRIDILRSIQLEAGPSGHRARYDELAATARPRFVTDDVAVQLLSLAHLLRSKAALGRPHDLAVVRELTALETAAPPPLERRRRSDPEPPGLGL